MKDDKKEVMGTEEPFEEQELIHTQDFEHRRCCTAPDQ